MVCVWGDWSIRFGLMDMYQYWWVNGRSSCLSYSVIYFADFGIVVFKFVHRVSLLHASCAVEIRKEIKLHGTIEMSNIGPRNRMRK